MSAPIPSFSSFKGSSKQKNIDSRDEGEHKSRKEKHKHRDERERSHKRRSRSRSSSRERHSKRSKHSSRKDDKLVGPSGWKHYDDEKLKAAEDIELTKAKDSDEPAYVKGYYVDKKGDPLNITYGGLHKGDIPKFHRAGRGRILGLSSNWNIKRGSGLREVEIVTKDRRKDIRYVDSKAYRDLVQGPHRRLVLRNEPTPSSEEFIPIGKIKRQTEVDPQDSYRSIEAEKEREYDSDASRTESSSDESEGPGLTAEQESIKELERKLGRDPGDESSWLKLLDLSVKSIPTTAKHGARARADIAISILQRAISAHPANELSLLLRLTYLDYGSEIWMDDKLEEEWKDGLARIGGVQSEPRKRSVIWLSWLEWRLFSSKSISAALSHAKATISALSGSEYEMARVRACWRTAIFLREAGFLEQAYAIFQAQIELSDFCPEILASLPLNARIDRLEEFWESEMPRIGEKNAAGWAMWEKRGRPEPEEDFLDSLRDLVGFSISDDPYQLWFRRESACDLIGAISTRSFNEDQQDPFTTILFNDIREFLSDIRSDNARSFLRLAFLCFNGLNIPGLNRANGWDASPQYMQLLQDSWMLSGRGGWMSRVEDLFPPVEKDRLLTWESHAGVTIAAEKPRPSSFSPVKDWSYTRPFLEGIGKECKYRAWETDDVYNIDLSRIQLILQQLQVLGEAVKWEEMSVALSASSDMKGTIKDSKQALEADSASIAKWERHAKLERMRGKYPEASKIYKMTISMNAQSINMPSLIADAVEFFWLQSDPTQAKELLFAFLGIQGDLSGLNLLRARRTLEAKASQYFSSTKQRDACLRIRFFVELVSSNIEEASLVLEKHLEDMQDGPGLHESITTWLCVTLYEIAQLRGSMVPRSTVAGRVASAVTQYPHNTILLGLFLECERGFGIWGNVRKMLDSGWPLAGSEKVINKSLMSLCWDIWAEGWGYGPWDMERVRSRLEWATTTSSLRHSVLLWRIYMALEMRLKNLQRAKAVLIRGLGSCPWAKELYMIAFGPLRHVFKARELNDLVSTMVERGIRMRRDISDLLVGWKDPSAMELDQGYTGGDVELEMLMHDREHAKPY
ncbi:DUF1740-domain-containing protein [Serendipita vermifera]|nr:DUF1740-domain-containing protein [Serendipita vermifera]